MSDLIFFEVDISHPCWFVDLTEHNPDAQLKALQIVGMRKDNVDYLVELTSPNPRKDIEFIRKHELVKRVEIILLKPDSAVLKVTFKFSSLTLSILNESNVTLLESPVTRHGVDKEILMAKNYKDLSNLISAWKEQGWDVRLRKKRYLAENEVKSLGMFKTSGFFDLTSAKEVLTDKQLEVFSKACDWGYYEIPKKVSIEELAEKLDLSPSTLAEHLRKAEAKLMPVLLTVLRKI
ncbi:MAG: helix-turn-helix domain-containing protein [Candidatus Micrarchaeota archaeon]